MNRKITLPLLVGASAIALMAFTTDLQEKSAPVGEQAALANILDPLELQATICSNTGKKYNSAFKPSSAAAQLIAKATMNDDAENVAPPLWDNLGALTFPISTDNKTAQAYFDQGLRLTYGFNHWEAARAFRMAQRLDPECAMCAAGEALVLGPNINQLMLPEDVKPAYDAAQRALALSNHATATERALIEAIAARYAEEQPEDRTPLDQAFADKLGPIAEANPDNHHIQVIYAESLMDLQPWNYWDSDLVTPIGNADTIIETVEHVLAANPDHAGAIHLYIHILEASRRAKDAEPYADRLGKQIPGSGHLVHMPAHIYYRLGRFKDSIAANVQAVKVDETYLEQVQATGIYPGGYYPHNVHFVVTSGAMAGDAANAVPAAEKLTTLIPADVAAAVPWIQVIVAAPYYAHAQMSDVDTVLALPEADERLPFVAIMRHYARGTALAAAGRLEEAAAEKEAMLEIEAASDFSALNAGAPATQVMEIAHLVLGGA